MYNTISSYNTHRQFGDDLIIDANDNASLCVTNPYCAPGFTQRTTINETQQRLFSPIDRTVQKDVWGPGTCCLRQSLLQQELDNNWTVFQRRTFTKTPVLWMREVVRNQEP